MIACMLITPCSFNTLQLSFKIPFPNTTIICRTWCIHHTAYLWRFSMKCSSIFWLAFLWFIAILHGRCVLNFNVLKPNPTSIISTNEILRKYQYIQYIEYIVKVPSSSSLKIDSVPFVTVQRILIKATCYEPYTSQVHLEP